MQCKPLVSSLAVALALMFVLLSNMSASAHTAVPASFDCSTGCRSYSYWNGNAWGALESFTISKPGINNSTEGYWNRFLALRDGTRNRLIIGESRTKGRAFGDYCVGNGDSTTHYFVYAFDSTGRETYQVCIDMPAGDENQTGTFSVWQDWACSEGDGQHDEYRYTISTPNKFVSNCVDPEINNFTQIRLDEEIADNPVNGHQVWGSQWLLSSYVGVGNTNNFAYQTRGVDFLTARNPPQMYWHTNPAPGNSGGNQYSCVYDTGTTCTPGS